MAPRSNCGGTSPQHRITRHLRRKTTARRARQTAGEINMTVTKTREAKRDPQATGLAGFPNPGSETRRAMSKRLYFFALVFGMLLFAGVARAQYPILDKIANKVVQKYQNSTCEQLWQKK